MRIFDKPPRYPREAEILDKTVDELVLKSYPNFEGQHPIFRKFGVRTGGTNDTWLYTEDWQTLSEVEKWKYVALCALWWENMYRYWSEKEEFNQYLEYLREQGQIELFKHLNRLEREEVEKYCQEANERNAKEVNE